MKLLQRFAQMGLCILLCFSFQAVLAQNQNRVQYFPANQSYAGLFTYSTLTGTASIYYADNDEWTKETSITSPDLSISGKDFRMKYISGNPSTLPGLFVYSTTSGAYEFFYLENGKWSSNKFLPTSKSNLSSKKVRMDFVPGDTENFDYISIYATDKKEFEIVYLSNNEWVASEFLPKKLTY